MRFYFNLYSRIYPYIHIHIIIRAPHAHTHAVNLQFNEQQNVCYSLSYITSQHIASHLISSRLVSSHLSSHHIHRFGVISTFLYVNYVDICDQDVQYGATCQISIIPKKSPKFTSLVSTNWTWFGS